jgi:hypothetical protein
LSSGTSARRAPAGGPPPSPFPQTRSFIKNRIASGKATRCVRDTTPRAPGRCSAMPGVPGLSGAKCTADPKHISSFTHRLRLWLDARYVVGDVGRSGPGSLLRLGSDAGSSPSSSHLCLPAKLQHVCSLAQPYHISRSAAGSGKASGRSSALLHMSTIPESESGLHKEWCATHHALLQEPFALAPDRPWLRSWQSSKSSNIMTETRYRRWEELRPLPPPSHTDRKCDPGWVGI